MIGFARARRRGNAFSLAVTFEHDATQGATDRRENFVADRGGPSEHQTNLASHRFADFIEHDLVPQRVVTDDSPKESRGRYVDILTS